MRGVLAVLGGFAAWSILWLAANGTLSAMLPDLFAEDGSTRHAGLLACVLGVAVVCSLLGGFVTAALAPQRPGIHVWVLALIQLAVGIAVQAGYWSVLPLWYNLLFLGLLVPMHVAGGHLQQRRRAGVGRAALSN